MKTQGDNSVGERKKDKKRKQLCTQGHHYGCDEGHGDPSQSITGMTHALEVVTALITGVIASLNKHTSKNTLIPAF